MNNIIKYIFIIRLFKNYKKNFNIIRDLRDLRDLLILKIYYSLYSSFTCNS